MKKTRIISIVVCAALMLVSFAACGSSDTSGEDTAASSDNTDQTYSLASETLKEFSEDELLSGKHHVEMTIQDKGTITLELDADQAPISVTNFIDLAESGFYDGLTFHRIIPYSFMQGGDPEGNGTGSPGYTIKGEFTANGVDNTLSHTRGAISMARTSEYDGGGCQFFIMDEDYVDFDGQYACFGYVTDGMDIVDDICANAQITDQNGTVADGEQPVIETVKVVD